MVYTGCHKISISSSLWWQKSCNITQWHVKLNSLKPFSTQNITQRCESFNEEIDRIMTKTFTNYHYEMGVSSAVLK